MKVAAISLLLAGLLLAGTVLALDGLDIPRQLIGGGGGSAQYGAFVLQSSVGQPVAGRVQLGGYALTAGLWASGARYTVYLPLVLRNAP